MRHGTILELLSIKDDPPDCGGDGCGLLEAIREHAMGQEAESTRQSEEIARLRLALAAAKPFVKMAARVKPTSIMEAGKADEVLGGIQAALQDTQQEGK